ILHVDFYDGASLISSVANAPYDYNWNNMTIGDHQLTAKVVCDNAIVLASSPTLVTITASAVLQELSGNSEITVYPIPVRETIILHSAHQLQGLNYTLYSISGQQVLSGQLSSDKIDVKDLSSGIYTLQVQGENHFISNKIIIQ
nr:T9SS type A sorting domain-containing protein [Bacteroidales bacterium]